MYAPNGMYLYQGSKIQIRGSSHEIVSDSEYIPTLQSESVTYQSSRT